MPGSEFDPVILRQKVLWVPADRRVPIDSTVELTGANTRIWTLFATDPDVKPELPIVPRHHHNAFLEDYMHDWNHEKARGYLRYASRAAEGSVWILVEHLKRPPRRKR